MGLNAFAARACRCYTIWGRELGWIAPEAAPAAELTPRLRLLVFSQGPLTLSQYYTLAPIRAQNPQSGTARKSFWEVSFPHPKPLPHITKKTGCNGPFMKCKICKAEAAVALRSHNAAFCPACYKEFFARQVTRGIEGQNLFSHEERVLVGAFGRQRFFGAYAGAFPPGLQRHRPAH